jgi:hypothetical protein
MVKLDRTASDVFRQALKKLAVAEGVVNGTLRPKRST